MSSGPRSAMWKCVMCEKTVHQQAIVRTFNDELGVCIKCDRDDERVPHTPEGESSG